MPCQHGSALPNQHAAMLHLPANRCLFVAKLASKKQASRHMQVVAAADTGDTGIAIEGIAFVVDTLYGTQPVMDPFTGLEVAETCPVSQEVRIQASEISEVKSRRLLPRCHCHACCQSSLGRCTRKLPEVSQSDRHAVFSQVPDADSS